MMSQDISVYASISIDDVVLDFRYHIKYHQQLSLDINIDKPLAKEAVVMTNLSERVWDNSHLRLPSKGIPGMCTKYFLLQQHLLENIRQA